MVQINLKMDGVAPISMHYVYPMRRIHYASSDDYS